MSSLDKYVSVHNIGERAICNMCPKSCNNKSADPLGKYKKAAIEIYTLKVEKSCQARAVLMNHVDKDLHPQCSLSSF